MGSAGPVQGVRSLTSARDLARLSPVWPPMVGRTASGLSCADRACSACCVSAQCPARVHAWSATLAVCSTLCQSSGASCNLRTQGPDGMVLPSPDAALPRPGCCERAMACCAALPARLPRCLLWPPWCSGCRCCRGCHEGRSCCWASPGTWNPTSLRLVPVLPVPPAAAEGNTMAAQPCSSRFGMLSS